MEKEISYKQVGIANVRDGEQGNKVTGRRIFAIAFNGERKMIPADSIARAKFVIDMAIEFGIQVADDCLNFNGEKNLWFSFHEIATNRSIRSSENVADCISFQGFQEVK